MQRLARREPDLLVIGVDANADGLRDASRRAARAGENALFGRMALDAAPGELAGIAHSLTVLLPWGSLLGALARPDPTALVRLTELCRPGAEIRVVLGYDSHADAAAIRDLALPPLEPGALAARYREAGLAATARGLAIDEVRALPTTWAKKLAFSGKDRRFVEVSAIARAR